MFLLSQDLVRLREKKFNKQKKMEKYIPHFLCSRKYGYKMFCIFSWYGLEREKHFTCKTVTQCPRVSYRDRDVFYGELNYYPGCP